MEENNKKKQKIYFAQTVILLTGVIGGLLCGHIENQSPERLLGNTIMILLLLAVSGLQFRYDAINHKLNYNNSEHVIRYLVSVEAGMLFAYVCCLLPTEGWPFLFLFVAISLFSNETTGIVTASSLLLIPVLVGGAGINAFALYFICGVFAVILFRNVEESNLGVLVLLSGMVMLVCLTSNVILTLDTVFRPELFIIPIVNIVINVLLIMIVLKYFFANIIYLYREHYLELNNPENSVMTELKTKDKNTYMRSIHTAYFCDRIGKCLQLDTDALKCAAYYHCMGEELAKKMVDKMMPPLPDRILSEYREFKKQGIRSREAAVLLYSDSVVSAYLLMSKNEGNNAVDIKTLIEAVDKKIRESSILDNCEITTKELSVMKKIFREEKLYYDFLRG